MSQTWYGEMASGPKLNVNVGANVDDFEKKFERIKKRADRDLGQMERRGKQFSDKFSKDITGGLTKIEDALATFGKGFAAGILGAGVGGIASAVTEMTKSFADLGREAKTANLDVEDFQRWRYVADQNRIGVDGLIDGFKELSLRASEYVSTAGKSGSAADAFRQLGLSPQEVQERIKDPSKFMLELIDRIQRLKNTAQGVQLTDELFGGQGGEQFVRLIDQGREGITGTLNEAEKMGAVFDANFIAKADEVDRAFNRLATTMGVAVKGAIVEAAGALQAFLSSWTAMENKTLSGVDAELAQLAQRKAQLQSQAGGTEDYILGFIGKDAATEIGNIDSKMADLQKRKDELTGVKLDTIEIGQPYTPLAAPKSGKSDAEKAREKAAKAAERERKAVQDLIADLQFEASLVGKTALEKEKMTAVRQAGTAATAAEKAQIESLVESTYKANEAFDKQKAQLEELRDAGRDFAGTLVDGLLEGESATEVLSSALKQLASRILNSGLDQLFGIGGGGGLLSGLFGGSQMSKVLGGAVGLFDQGGYTGAGGKYQPAGVVHKGEYVFDADSVRKAGGPAALEAMRRGLKGYANGGAVGMTTPTIQAPRLPNLASMTTNNTSSPTITYAPVVNAQGADSTAVAKLAQELDKQRREFSTNVLATMTKAKQNRVWKG